MPCCTGARSRMLATSAHPLNVERLRLLCQPPIARLAPPLHLSEALVLGNLREDVRLVLLALLVAAMGHTIPYWSVRASSRTTVAQSHRSSRRPRAVLIGVQHGNRRL